MWNARALRRPSPAAVCETRNATNVLLRLNNVVPDCVADQPAERPYAELLHEASSVILCRSHADREQVCDLFVALTLRQQLDDFLFPAGEAAELMLSAMRRSGGRSFPLRTIEHNARYRRTDKSPSTQHGLSCGEQTLLCVGFQYVAIGPGPQRSLDELLFVVHAQNQNVT